VVDPIGTRRIEGVRGRINRHAGSAGGTSGDPQTYHQP
jgi:hypothetical protein